MSGSRVFVTRTLPGGDGAESPLARLQVLADHVPETLDLRHQIAPEHLCFNMLC